jgi:3-hydroxybutyryl-CoA dehydrogenase
MSALPKDSVVATVGAGAMGAGIAQIAAAAGHCVLLFDVKEQAAEKARLGIVAGLNRLVEKSKLTAAQRDAIAARIRAVTHLAELAPAALVVEAIVEDLAVKQTLFAQLEGVVSSTAILATNTSSLSVTALASKLAHPERVAGFHFFNPAPLMALVEVVSGLATKSAVLDCLFATAESWGKRPVRARSTPGFIVNRVARPFYGEGWRLLEENVADHATLDLIMREAGGFRMGPFELMDLIGHDVNFAVTRSVFQSYFGDPRYRPSLRQQELVEAGWLGRKSGRGMYEYAPDATRAAARFIEGGLAPRSVRISGELGVAEPLVDMMRAAGVDVRREDGEPLIHVPGATLALTDGRTATERVAAGARSDLVLFDLALDYARCGVVALVKADQAPPSAVIAAAALFQALGKQVCCICDSPALVVMRTVAMLANEAADAVLQGVASSSDVDCAMTYGVNYPRGPLAWAEGIGLWNIVQVLDRLSAHYGEERYRTSAWLRRQIARKSSVDFRGEVNIISDIH